jgi:hypothetical protein
MFARKLLAHHIGVAVMLQKRSLQLALHRVERACPLRLPISDRSAGAQIPSHRIAGASELRGNALRSPSACSHLEHPLNLLRLDHHLDPQLLLLRYKVA